MKFIKYSLTFIVIIFSNYLLGQNLKIKYCENRIIKSDKLSEMPLEIKQIALKKNYYILTIDSNNGISYYANDSLTKNIEGQFENENKNENDGIVEITTTKTTTNIRNIEKFYYKNINENIMLFEFFNGDQLFQGNDVLQNWNWEITEEQKTIEGYLCKKAKSNWLGYDFTAWFTEDIPVNSGPEKFDGLPGLILYVGTPYYEYSAISIETINNNVEISKPNFQGNKTYTLSEIKTVMNQKMKNLKSSETTTQEGNTTIKKKTIIIK